MDAVIGRVGGKCLLTLLHRPTRFQLALLLGWCASAEVICALNLVASAMGERTPEVMHPMLTDNGTEFFDAEGVESAIRCVLYYCESYVTSRHRRVSDLVQECLCAIEHRYSEDSFWFMCQEG